MIEPGATWTPEWTIDQPATTSWFHPHPHERTAMHVYRGLAGLFIIDDPDGPQLPGRYGVDDVPLIIQDKRFDDDGRLATGGVNAGSYGLLGDTILANGTGPTSVVTTAGWRSVKRSESSGEGSATTGRCAGGWPGQPKNRRYNAPAATVGRSADASTKHPAR
jgi:FtsP/CotA-like multicopper oxidase with cupredoxin domain